MNQQSTCGQGLAANSVLPVKAGELIGALADVLKLHMSALDLTDPNSQKENAAYRQLAEAARLASDQLASLGRDMAGYRQLPMGRHNMEAMAAPAPRNALRTFVELEQELLSLLQQRIPQDRQMLQQMGATG